MLLSNGGVEVWKHAVPRESALATKAARKVHVRDDHIDGCGRAFSSRSARTAGKCEGRMSGEPQSSEAALVRRSGSRARLLLGALLLPWSLAVVALACSSELGSSIADGRDASSNRVGPDSATSNAPDSSASPSEAGPPISDGGEDAGQDADAQVLLPSGGPAGVHLVACGSETCTAVTQACTGVLRLVLPGFEDAAVSDASACQPYPISAFNAVACDDPTDCFPADCVVRGMSLSIAAPEWADAGLSSLGSSCRTGDSDSVTFATDAQPASFQLRTCGDAAPCPSGQTCHRQTCQGFAFSLCGDIPPGACAR